MIAIPEPSPHRWWRKLTKLVGAFAVGCAVGVVGWVLSFKAVSTHYVWDVITVFDVITIVGLVVGQLAL